MEDNDIKKEIAEKSLAEDDRFRFGSYDPHLPTSQIPCGGCGALLHSKDPKMPGFTPVEIFRDKTDEELRQVICQRCYVMKEYNIALKMTVHPDYYPETLKHVHTKRAIVLLMIDLLDFPGSVWPGILDILGPQKKLVLVGNKVDMLPQDSDNYLKRIRESMKKVFLEKCNNGYIKYDPDIVSSILVSARTGYNVEKLIDLIYTAWNDNRYTVGADIYLIGTTNCGKSSLFNKLLDSDLCKIKAIGKVEKAMTSPVPGTTLNLLKFPVMKPDPSRLFMRSNRLKRTMRLFNMWEKERFEKLRETKNVKYSILRGPVELTFYGKQDKDLPLSGENVLFNLEPNKRLPVSLPARLDPNSDEFCKGHWCFDTPGTVSKDQIINLLTQEEVARMNGDLPWRGRTFCIRNGQSLFIAGLARFDLLEGPFTKRPLLITVFCADELPINMVRTEDAEEFYKSALGTEVLGVPFGNPIRLKDFPELKGEEYEVDGISHDHASCDIVLSSAGWITPAPSIAQVARVKAWTPGGKGIYLRDPPFLPFAHMLRGHRIKGTPAHTMTRVYIPFTRWN